MTRTTATPRRAGRHPPVALPTMGVRRLPMAAAVVVGMLSLGCSLDALPSGQSDEAGASGGGGSGGAATPDCSPGQIVGPDSKCMAVGIQDCAEIFVEDDNLCHPRMDKCPAGTIPKFDEGCVPVGIQGCPEVFMEDDGLCHPSMDKCPAGTFAASLLGCVPIDGPDGCGTGTWGNITDGPSTVWVDPAYAGGDGDGSQDQPLATIEAALVVVPEGGRIALAAGSYDEPVRITRPVEIEGRCPSMITITGTEPTGYGYWYWGEHRDAVVLVEATAGVAIRNVSLSGPGYGIIAVASTVTLEGLHIHETMNSGIMAQDGAAVRIDRCLVEHTRPDPVAGTAGAGLTVYAAARATVADSAFLGNHHVGVQVVWGQAELEATGMLVEDTHCETAGGEFGYGLVASEASVVRVESSAFVRNRGMNVMGWGAELELTDSLVAATQKDDHGSAWGGVSLSNAAWGRVRGCAIVENVGSAAQFTQASGELRGNLLRGSVWWGVGLMLQSSTASVLDNAAVGNERTGLLLYEPGPGIVMEGNLAEGNGMPEPCLTVDCADGLGVYFSEDAVVRGNASVANYGRGIAIGEASAVLEHNLAEHTLSASGAWRRDGQGYWLSGRNVEVQARGLVALGNVTRGLWLDGGVLDLRRALIAGTGPRPSDGELGCGLVIENADEAAVDQVVLADNHLTGALLHSSPVTFTNGRITATHEGGFTGLVCPIMPCPWNKTAVYQGIADGLIAASSTVDLRDVRVDGCSRAGVLFHASDGSLDNVVSTDNGFGLVLQSSPRPELGAGCVFDPNAEQNVLADSELAIPNGSSARPEGQ